MQAPRRQSFLPHAVCEQARLNRDARFDGLFYAAVISTRIYCRPTCPARAAREGGVRYVRSAAEAESEGFRPCLRCRPERSPRDGRWRHGDDVLARALALIDDGALVDGSANTLAPSLLISDSTLDALFLECVGATPSDVCRTRRLLFAKQLLSETTLSIENVALAAGFGSVRRLNDVFRATYRMTPRDVRRPAADVRTRFAPLTLRLDYRPPFDFAWALDFLRGHALPGVEHVDALSYTRTVAGVGHAGAATWLRISAWDADSHALRLQIHAPDVSRLGSIVQRVRRMFDLDADPAAIANGLSGDARLAPLVARHPGLRLPVGWDGFEIAVRAILGQQVSVAAARTFAARAANLFGAALDVDDQTLAVTRVFPTAQSLVDADIGAIGITRTRANTLRTIARAVLDDAVDFRADRTLADHVARWTALPGIGPWTAHYIAMRALGYADAFPAEDLVLQKALVLPPDDADTLLPRATAKALAQRAESWRPWRAYAAIHLWRDAIDRGLAGGAKPLATAALPI